MNNEPLLRFSLLLNGQQLPVYPAIGGNLTLTREAADESFYTRDKLSGPLLLGGANDPDTWRILYALDNSRDRCRPLYLLLETRPYAGAAWSLQWRGTFTCNECKFDRGRCQVEVSPVTDDGYRELLENWEREYNLLSYATKENRRSVTAQLKQLGTTDIEFLRIDSKQEADFIGSDGWAVFLRDKSFISGTLTQGNTRNRTTILFRYRLREIPMVKIVGTSEYTVLNKTDGGWEVLGEPTFGSGTPTVDYVKTPEISGFPRGGYLIGTYNDWAGRVYGDQLVLLDCGTPNPDPTKYIAVTGPDGYGANNKECGACLNMRRNVSDKNCKALYWRFGEFRFTRGFPLLDAIYGLLRTTVAATPGAASIVPPDAARISDFFTNPINPATGAVGGANEVPGLLLSAASDVKRYGASEPATKVLISLKALLDDLAALYDVGWFIDPITGWFRIEHRSYRETGPAAAVLDLTTAPEAILPEIYSYRTDKLPRTEELTIVAALTQDTTKGYYFDQASIEYTGHCVNTREGQNKQTRSVSRLTGDVAGLVLSGDALPDSALVVLAAPPAGVLEDGNRKMAASELLKRYHRRGRVRATGSVAGQAVAFQSVKPGRLQEGLSARLCSLDQLGPSASIVTNLGAEGQLEKAEWDLLTGIVTFSVALPTPDNDTPGPIPGRRAFNDAFNPSFG